jgi:hypothetical protein
VRAIYGAPPPAFLPPRCGSMRDATQSATLRPSALFPRRPLASPHPSAAHTQTTSGSRSRLQWQGKGKHIQCRVSSRVEVSVCCVGCARYASVCVNPHCKVCAWFLSYEFVLFLLNSSLVDVSHIYAHIPAPYTNLRVNYQGISIINDSENVV